MTLGKDLTQYFQGARVLNRNFSVGSADLPLMNPSYSMQGEDLVVRSLLKGVLKSGKVGFYADLGAYVPRYGSNTYLFYQYGWRGVCVEPNPKLADIYKAERPRDTFISAAVGPDGMGYWAEGKAGPATSKVARTAAEFGEESHAPIEMPFISMKTLFETHAPPEGIDYLNLDVEGFELEALQGNDWTRFRPKIILIEENNLDVTNLFAAPALQFLRAQGYVPRAVLWPNVILELP